MASPVCEVFLTTAPIPTPRQSYTDETGGVVDFWGVVRATEEGRKLSGIAYEAHRSMAEHQLRAILDTAAQDFPLHEAVIIHRLGFVPAGEASLFVRVGSRHRAATFQASAWVVEELKKRAPIWKHVRYLAPAETEAAV